MPSAEPGSVTPRMKRISSTTYGNVAVKYTACRGDKCASVHQYTTAQNIACERHCASVYTHFWDKAGVHHTYTCIT